MKESLGQSAGVAAFLDREEGSANLYLKVDQPRTIVIQLMMKYK